MNDRKSLGLSETGYGISRWLFKALRVNDRRDSEISNTEMGQKLYKKNDRCV